MHADAINDCETVSCGGKSIFAGRYRVVKPLGRGGMGSVWLVEDLKLDGKRFAVKTLPSVLVADKRAYAQVKREALVAMKLVHPNIVQVRAFEEDGSGGNPFLVMDYVDGRSLGDILAEKGKLSEQESERILGPVAEALDYAHSKGVVHRDVKPGNVMVGRDGTPYVLDFGIAREMRETMTRVTGKLSSGTLSYMSPEQLRGALPDPSQDVYSFAALAYECLSGRPPFCRGNIEYQIVNEKPEPLSRDFALGERVMAGLSKKASSRPGSCKAVLERARRQQAPEKPPLPRRTHPAESRYAPLPPRLPAARPAPPPSDPKRGLYILLFAVVLASAALLTLIVLRERETDRIEKRMASSARASACDSRAAAEFAGAGRLASDEWQRAEMLMKDGEQAFRREEWKDSRSKFMQADLTFEMAAEALKNTPAKAKDDGSRKSTDAKRRVSDASAPEKPATPVQIGPTIRIRPRVNGKNVVGTIEAGLAENGKTTETTIRPYVPAGESVIGRTYQFDVSYFDKKTGIRYEKRFGVKMERMHQDFIVDLDPVCFCGKCTKNIYGRCRADGLCPDCGAKISKQ
ncbi:MAG: serine/threonine protein kinase [Kiritimatiellae bacterium]|nr:serine/threonine protein kinase [Kiritimatiellia bacterium]